MPDREAISRLKTGDLRALESLITRYQVKAIRAAYFIIQDESAAEDIVQDAFIRIIRRIHQFDENRPFEPYLMRSVVNAALNAARKARHTTSLDTGDSLHAVETLLAQAATLEDQVEAAELQQAILAAIAALPPRQRAAVVQRYYLEMSEQEMAAALGAAPGTVKWLLHTARARLARLLGSQRSAP